MTVYSQFAEGKKNKGKICSRYHTALADFINFVRAIGLKTGFATTASNIIPRLKQHKTQYIVALRIEDHDVHLLRKMKMSRESLDQGMNRSYDSF
jgi:hypothetical protein